MIYPFSHFLHIPRFCLRWRLLPLWAFVVQWFFVGCATQTVEPIPPFVASQSQSASFQLFHQDIPSLTGEALFQKGSGTDISLYITKGNIPSLHLMRVGSTWFAEGKLAGGVWIGGDEQLPRRLRRWVVLLQTYEAALSAPDGETIHRSGDQWASILKEDRHLLAFSLRYGNLNYRVRFSE